MDQPMIHPQPIEEKIIHRKDDDSSLRFFPASKPRIFRSISDGFKITFSNKRFWILIGILAIVINIVISAIPNVIASQSSNFSAVSTVSQVISAVFMFILSLILYRSALKDIDSHMTVHSDIAVKDPNSKKKANWSNIGLPSHIGAILIVSLVPLAVISLFSGAGVMLSIAIAPLVGMASLISLLISPLYMYAKWLIIDGITDNAKDAFTLAFHMGMKTYIKTILMILASTFVMFFCIIFTLGIGTIFIIPVIYNVEASFYRQALYYFHTVTESIETETVVDR